MFPLIRRPGTNLVLSYFAQKILHVQLLYMVFEALPQYFSCLPSVATTASLYNLSNSHIGPLLLSLNVRITFLPLSLACVMLSPEHSEAYMTLLSLCGSKGEPADQSEHVSAGLDLDWESSTGVSHSKLKFTQRPPCFPWSPCRILTPSPTLESQVVFQDLDPSLLWHLSHLPD